MNSKTMLDLDNNHELRAKGKQKRVSRYVIDSSEAFLSTSPADAVYHKTSKIPTGFPLSTAQISS